MIEKGQKQAVFKRGEEKLLPGFGRSPAHGIDGDIAQRDDALAAPGEAQDIADARDQLPRPEGLGNVVVCPQLKAGDGAEFIPRSRQEDDRQAVFRLDRLADRKAVAVSQ